MAGARPPHSRCSEAPPLPTIRTVDSTASTNADMLSLAARGLDEGVWLRAERQTAGRGREGRAWMSPVGNLHASTLVRLRPGDPPAPGLALVAGVVLAQVLAELPFCSTTPPPRDGDLPPDPPRPAPREAGGIALKWPNDVLLARAKLAGILLERADEAVVIGLGVNVASFPEAIDRPATSLAAHGVTIAPEPLLHRIATALPDLVAIWRVEGLEPIRRRWLGYAHPVGTPLTARLPDGTTLDGRFAGLTPDGALRLGLAGGGERVIHAGDVFAV